MQEGNPDYYDLTMNDSSGGCCLLCAEAEKGCLCTDCKCKSCYWYNPEFAGLSPCDKVMALKEESKKTWIEAQKEKHRIENEKFRKKLAKYNVDKLSSRTAQQKCNELLNTYTCQRCSIEFTTPNDLIIIQSESPLCEECEEELKRRKE